MKNIKKKKKNPTTTEQQSEKYNDCKFRIQIKNWNLCVLNNMFIVK